MSFIQDRDDIEFIRETSDKALDMMAAHNIVPLPMNYHIWYTYSSGEDLALSQLIDGMVAKNKNFSREVCENLYERFFSGQAAQSAVTEAGQSIQKELAKIAQTLKESGDSTSAFSISLKDHLGSLAKIDGGRELMEILAAIVQDTKTMQEKNLKMEAELKASSQEIQKLQNNLKAVQQENLTDMLTNIGNRKCFEEKFDEAFKRCSASGENMCLVIGDIDFFKRFNDTWGHSVGDQILKAVAHVMKLRVGDNGTPARYGGEEFVIVLPGLSLDEATALANAIRESVAMRSMNARMRADVSS